MSWWLLPHPLLPSPSLFRVGTLAISTVCQWGPGPSITGSCTVSSRLLMREWILLSGILRERERENTAEHFTFRLILPILSIETNKSLFCVIFFSYSSSLFQFVYSSFEGHLFCFPFWAAAALLFCDIFMQRILGHIWGSSLIYSAFRLPSSTVLKFRLSAVFALLSANSTSCLGVLHSGEFLQLCLSASPSDSFHFCPHEFLKFPLQGDELGMEMHHSCRAFIWHTHAPGLHLQHSNSHTS